ncbi:MAG: amino acid adenylation domain-containing protein, partial [Acidobacteriota bacterium]
MTEVAAAPVSFAQQGLWYQAELEPGNPAYHVPVVLSLRGAIDRRALVAALEAIVARHEILRTTFAHDGSELLQVIHPRMSLPFRDELLEGGEEQLRAEIREEIHKPFDLVHGPLMRCVLFQRTPHDHAVLLLTMHHLVTDGWSLGVMMKELAAFYRGAPLADLEIQYADFAEWQREQADHAWADQLAYWKERLRGPLPRTEFPADFQAPASPSFEGATETFRIATATLDALREQSRESGSTLFMTLLAAFKVLLFRHTSQDDVVVGSPVASRNRAAIENLVGFFVNTQVLRTSLAGNPTFLEVLRRVRETTLAAWENQDVPFELVTSVLQPERTRDRSPFFQVMFALQNALPTTLDLPGVSVERIDFVTDTAKLALTVITEEIDGELELRMEYSTALFARETIQRIGRRYERLLQAVCANPEGSIDQLTMLPDAESVLLDRWEGEGRHFEVAEPLNRRFERQARVTPDRIALRWEGQQLSYRQLNAKANQLARHLQSMGVGIETLVGLSLDRSIDLVVGILAILKAGGAYVPLDPSYPRNRLQFVMEDSAVPVVIARSENEAAVKSAPQVVVLDREEQAIAAYADDDLATAAGTTNAAYVIYTSGSTGQPKGVIVTHLNVARLMASTESLFHFGEDDVWTLFHSYAFDFSVWEMWGALLYGGRLLVVPYATSRTPELFHQLLTDEGVTILNQTPSAFYELMEYAPPRSLRYVIFGGEALDVHRLRPWLERYGDEHPQLVNMYGITETTVHVTYSQILRSGSAIGRPLPDLRVSILDERKQRVPIGIAGEMYVGGAGVARGYLHRDELTAARFLDRGEGRVYRTGDLARWTSSGELEYLGRIDTQVKIRGFRIELGEIEQALRAVAGVRDAVVVARQQRLIAYCIAASTVTPNT